MNFLKSLKRAMTGLIHSVFPSTKPVPQPRQTFVLLTGKFDGSEIRVNGQKVGFRQHDDEAADLDLGPEFKNKRAQSYTIGNTTYILWKHAGEVPALLKTGVRYQKDLGDLKGKSLDLSEKGLSTAALPPSAQDLAAQRAAAEKAARFVRVAKAMEPGDSAHGLTPGLTVATTFTAAVDATEISMHDALRQLGTMDESNTIERASMGNTAVEEMGSMSAEEFNALAQTLSAPAPAVPSSDLEARSREVLARNAQLRQQRTSPSDQRERVTLELIS